MCRFVQLGSVQRVKLVASYVYDLWESAGFRYNSMCFSGETTFAYRLLEVDVEQHTREYFHVISCIHQAPSLDDIGMGFHKQVTLSIA